MTIQQNQTANFLVPPQGATNVLSATLPADGNFGPIAGGGQYGIDFRSLGQIIQGSAFIPQSCTIDATQLSSGNFLTFSIPVIGMNWLIFAGQTRTFQFPALPDLQILITPNTGNPTVNCSFYNYPALPDEQGGSVTTISGSVVVSAMPAVDVASLPSGTGTDGSSTPPTLLTNHLTSIAANSNRQGYLIQNLSTDPVQVVLSAAGTGGTVYVLNPASIAGQAGASIDFSGVPHNGQIDIYGTSGSDSVSARVW